MWHECDGDRFDPTDSKFETIYDIIGDQFGTYFPDCTDRVIIHGDTIESSFTAQDNIVVGDTGGVSDIEFQNLFYQHNHPLIGTLSDDCNHDIRANIYPSGTIDQSLSLSSSNFNNVTFNNQQPWIAMQFLIVAFGFNPVATTSNIPAVDELIIGQIVIYAGADTPNAAFLACNGSLVSKTVYSELYEVIGDNYATTTNTTTTNTTWTTGADNDSSDMFRLPDCQQRALIGAKTSPGILPDDPSSVTEIGTISGESDTVYNVYHIPVHNHGILEGYKIDEQCSVSLAVNDFHAVYQNMTYSQCIGDITNLMPTISVEFAYYNGDNLDWGAGHFIGQISMFLFDVEATTALIQQPTQYHLFISANSRVSREIHTHYYDYWIESISSVFIDDNGGGLNLPNLNDYLIYHTSVISKLGYKIGNSYFNCQDYMVPHTHNIELYCYQPTNEPTIDPTQFPSQQPSQEPSFQPTQEPSSEPSNGPTVQPSKIPSDVPSSHPSEMPSDVPTSQPSHDPTVNPTIDPTSIPTVIPTQIPTTEPSVVPSNDPSSQPTVFPSRFPSQEPSPSPTFHPSIDPSNLPTSQPLVDPSSIPTTEPSRIPSLNPSSNPTHSPSECLDCITFGNVSVYSLMNETDVDNDIVVEIKSLLQTDLCQNSSKSQEWVSNSDENYNVVLFRNIDESQLVIEIIDIESGNIKYDLYFQIDFPIGHWCYRNISCINHMDEYFKDAYENLINYAFFVGFVNNVSFIVDIPYKSMKFSSCIDCFMDACGEGPPTDPPTAVPTVKPTSIPSVTPTQDPTQQPTLDPSSHPTQIPSFVPSDNPSVNPSYNPSDYPSTNPTAIPTINPSIIPTREPSDTPSNDPSLNPTQSPSDCVDCITFGHVTISNVNDENTVNQSIVSELKLLLETDLCQTHGNATEWISWHDENNVILFVHDASLVIEIINHDTEETMYTLYYQTNFPLWDCTHRVSCIHDMQDYFYRTSTLDHGFFVGFSSNLVFVINISYQTMKFTNCSNCTVTPCQSPSPTINPTLIPTTMPSNIPTQNPTVRPTILPSNEPTIIPTQIPTDIPTRQPTLTPSKVPSSQPTFDPTGAPTSDPSTYPTQIPSQIPSYIPTTYPTDIPSISPSNQPTIQPSDIPSKIPSRIPSRVPSRQPSLNPTQGPTCFDCIVFSNVTVYAANVSINSDGFAVIDNVTDENINIDINITTAVSELASALETEFCQFETNRSRWMNTDDAIYDVILYPDNSSFVVTLVNYKTDDIEYTLYFQEIWQWLYNCYDYTCVNHWKMYFDQVNDQDGVNNYFSGQSDDLMIIVNVGSIGIKTCSEDNLCEVPVCESPSPTSQPSGVPSQYPTQLPTNIPTHDPTIQPSQFPSSQPSQEPSSIPSLDPSVQPSETPSNIPTAIPSSHPSAIPSGIPTDRPSNDPTTIPTQVPTTEPSRIPSLNPSSNPTHSPSECLDCITFGNVSVYSLMNETDVDNDIVVEIKSLLQTDLCQNSSKSQEWVSNSDENYNVVLFRNIDESQLVIEIIDIESGNIKYDLYFQIDFPIGHWCYRNISCINHMDEYFKDAYENLINYAFFVGFVNNVSFIVDIPYKSMKFSSCIDCFMDACGEGPPTDPPTAVPTVKPTSIPSVTPTQDPTQQPTLDPSSHPTQIPFRNPSYGPSNYPTTIPSHTPSIDPSSNPTKSATECMDCITFGYVTITPMDDENILDNVTVAELKSLFQTNFCKATVHEIEYVAMRDDQTYVGVLFENKNDTQLVIEVINDETDEIKYTMYSRIRFPLDSRCKRNISCVNEMKDYFDKVQETIPDEAFFVGFFNDDARFMVNISYETIKYDDCSRCFVVADKCYFWLPTNSPSLLPFIQEPTSIPTLTPTIEPLCNPIDGYWTDYCEWSECYETQTHNYQQTYIQHRTRDCIDAQCGGEQCQGSYIEFRQCKNNSICNSQWSAWSDWSPCVINDESCLENAQSGQVCDGFEYRTRTCFTEQSLGCEDFHSCHCEGSHQQMRRCETRSCLELILNSNLNADYVRHIEHAKCSWKLMRNHEIIANGYDYGSSCVIVQPNQCYELHIYDGNNTRIEWNYQGNQLGSYYFADYNNYYVATNGLEALYRSQSELHNDKSDDDRYDFNNFRYGYPMSDNSELKHKNFDICIPSYTNEFNSHSCLKIEFLKDGEVVVPEDHSWEIYDAKNELRFQSFPGLNTNCIRSVLNDDECYSFVLTKLHANGQSTGKQNNPWCCDDNSNGALKLYRDNCVLFEWEPTGAESFTQITFDFCYHNHSYVSTHSSHY